jgi:hypothetical protein
LTPKFRAVDTVPKLKSRRKLVSTKTGDIAVHRKPRVRLTLVLKELASR